MTSWFCLGTFCWACSWDSTGFEWAHVWVSTCLNTFCRVRVAASHQVTFSRALFCKCQLKLSMGPVPPQPQERSTGRERFRQKSRNGRTFCRCSSRDGKTVSGRARAQTASGRRPRFDSEARGRSQGRRHAPAPAPHGCPGVCAAPPSVHSAACGHAAACCSAGWQMSTGHSSSCRMVSYKRTWTWIAASPDIGGDVI